MIPGKLDRDPEAETFVGAMIGAYVCFLAGVAIFVAFAVLSEWLR